jgi:hypothetical protein
VTEDIREEIKKFLGSNENEDTTYQNLWDTAKAVVRGKFTYISVYIFKKTKIFQVNNLMIHLKLLEKQEQTNSQTKRQREIIKTGAKIKEIKTQNIYKESMKQKVGSLKR